MQDAVGRIAGRQSGIINRAAGPLPPDEDSLTDPPRSALRGTDKRVAVVTGASSGIGRAVALALARAGVSQLLVGRDRDRLAQCVSAAQAFAPTTGATLDLTSEIDIDALAELARNDAGMLDVLVHSAGTIRQSTLEQGGVDALDAQYAINVRAPYVLTQKLRAPLVAAKGQIVFVNSSAGLSASRSDIAPYAASKHALKAIADSIRAEMNPYGVRVLSVYPGRTATPMQEAVFRHEGRPYDPTRLLQPDDVASIVLAALELPRTAEVTDISIRPMTPS
jgi:NADP-dependent 3-hydroxy acid dehydrogenase YdfG